MKVRFFGVKSHFIGPVFSLRDLLFEIIDLFVDSRLLIFNLVRCLDLSGLNLFVSLLLSLGLTHNRLKFLEMTLEKVVRCFGVLMSFSSFIEQVSNIVRN